MGARRQRPPRSFSPILRGLSAALAGTALLGSVSPAYATTAGVGAGGGATTAVSGALAEVVVDPSSSLVFATNPAFDRVEVISLPGGQLQSPIAVGSRPQGLALTPDGKTLYVADSGAGEVSVVDVATRRELHRIPVPPRWGENDTPYSIAVANNGLALLTTSVVAAGFDGRVLQIDVRTEAVTLRSDFDFNGLTSGKTRIASSGDHSRLGLVVSNLFPTPVFLYDASTNTFTPRKDLNSSATRFIALDGAGSSALVDPGTSAFDNRLNLAATIPGGGLGIALDGVRKRAYRLQASSIDVLDMNRLLPAATIALPESAGGGAGTLALTPDGTTLAAVTATGLSLVRVADQAQVAPTPALMSDVVVDPSSTHAYATNTARNEVEVVALPSGAHGAPIPVGSQPKGLAITPDGSRLYVANSGSAGVSVVDLSTRSELHRIVVAPNTPYDERVLSIGVASNGQALVTTTTDAEITTLHMMQIDLATESVRERPQLFGHLSEDTQVAVSGDHARVGVVSSLNGAVFRYDAATDTFAPPHDLVAPVHGIALDQTGSTLLVNGGTYVLDGALTLTGTIPGGGMGVAVSPQGRTGYRVQPSSVDVLDLGRDLLADTIALPEPVGPGAGNVAAGPDGVSLAVTTATGISVVQIRDQVPAAPPREPLNGIVIDPSSTHAFASDTALNQVDVTSLTTGRAETPIPVGSRPQGLALTPDGATLYVADSGSSYVSVVDVAARRELHRITVPPSSFTDDRPYSIATAANGNAFLTTTFGGGGYGARMLEINLATEAATLRTDFGSSGSTSEDTHITASGDHTMLAAVDGGTTQGEVWDYAVATDRFTLAHTFNSAVRYIGLDRTGSTTAVDRGTYILHGSTLAGVIPDGGGAAVALNSSGTIAYVVQSPGIAVLDATTMQMTGTLVLPEPVGRDGGIALSPDQRTLAVSTASGISLVSVRPPLAGVVGGDNALYTTSAPGGFRPLGGALLSAPAIVSVPASAGAPVLLYVAVAIDHTLYVRSDTAPWRRLVYSGCWDSPAALVTGDGSGGNTLTVACEGGDRGLYYWQTPVTSTALPVITTPYTPLAGLLAAGPAVTVVGGRITFVAIGIDNHAYSRSVGDAGYTSLPADCFGHPAVASTGPTAYMACQGLDGSLYYSSNSGSGWRQFRSAGGQIFDGPGLAVTTAGVIIYVEGRDAALYHTVVSLDGLSSTPYVADGGGIQFGAAATGTG